MFRFTSHLPSPVLSACLGAWIIFQSDLSAQVPPVQPTFPNNQTFTPGQLLFRQIGVGRTTNIIYHNGILYTNTVTGAGRRVWEWDDPSDVGSLRVTRTSGIPLYNDHGNHGHTKIGDWFGGQYGAGIRRGNAPGVNEFQAMPGWINNPGHQLYYPWGLPFNWIQYSNDGNGAANIYRGNDHLISWDSLAEDGVTGNSILLGNILLITSDETAAGILSYDISPIFEDPPQKPRLLDKLSGHIGAYIAVPWENYLVLARRDTNTVDIVDYSDPSNLTFVTSIDVSGNSALNASSNVPYTQAQDNFVFARRHKINMDTFTTVLELDEVGNNRPAGSVSGQLETSQYNMPLGQFLVTGAYSFSGRDGVGIWAHQAEPDTKKPYVGYHIPRDGQTNFPLGAPVSLLIHETLESFTIINGETVILRPVDGDPLDCWTSFSHDDVLTITPKQYLEPDTTYEVIVVDGGIKDAVGNGIEPYTFTFSTGSNVSGGNAAPQITALTATPSPTEPGETISFQVTAVDAESDPLEYRFNFGDGSESTAWGTTTTASRSYADVGHYEVKVQVRDTKPGGEKAITSRVLTVAVAELPEEPLPTNSSPIALYDPARLVWVVNPDNDSISAIHADNRQLTTEIPLGQLLRLGTQSIDPRNVAVDGHGQLWVTCHDADRIAILDATTGALIHQIDTGYGSAPMHAVPSPDGNTVYITLEGRGATNPANGQLLRFAAASHTETGRLELGPWPRAIAVTGSHDRVLVTRFISPENFGEVWDINPSTMTLTRTMSLYRDRGSRGKDSSSNGAGVPNYLAGITINPDGEWAWFSALKHQTQRGEFFDLGTGINEQLNSDHTVRSMIGRIDLPNNREPYTTQDNPNDSPRLDVDNSESPTAIAFSDRGDYAFVALQGNNEVAIYDVFQIRAGVTRATKWRIPAGRAPQGLVFDSSTQTLFVKNFLTRDVTIHDLGEFLGLGDRSLDPVTVSTVSSEKLAPEVLNGKQVFYNAADTGGPNGLNRMSLESYISCASCHADGMHDGRTWDFTQRGEGLRNTTDLRARGGMAHGNVHWTANFDEIQDFILDMVNEFGGVGFLPDGESPHPALGAPNAGRDPDLDDLATYVTSLGEEHAPRSPFRATNGTFTEAAARGAAVFQAQNCASCHVSSNGSYTDSTLPVATLHNVGTLRTSSGERLGGTLTGIDTPSLLGLWNGAPYFHDGSAETLEDVFVVAGGQVIQAESGSLTNGTTIPGYIDINHDGSSHGAFVQFSANSQRVTLGSVNGGSGGIGALEIRYQTGSNSTMRVQVNSSAWVSLALTAERTRLEWRRIRIENVSFNSGTNNTIRIEKIGGGNFNVDDVTVSTSNVLALAQPHRRVLNLSAGQQEDLRQYLLQLGDPITAPKITAQPVAQGIGLGDDAQFSVAGQFSGDVHYQWYYRGRALRNGPRYSGVDTDTLTVHGVFGADHGDFHVEIADATGQSLSSPAPLELVEGETFEDFMARHLTEGDEGIAILSSHDPLDNQEGDAFVDLLEFFFDGDPLDHDDPGLHPAFSRVPGANPSDPHWLELRFQQNLTAIGLNWEPVFSTNLGNWTVPEDFEEIELSRTGETREVLLRIPEPPNDGTVNLRLQVRPE